MRERPEQYDALAAGDADERPEAEALRIFGRGTCLARLLPGEDHALVYGAIPGERVRLRRLDRPGARRFTVEDVLQAAPDRVTPSCAVAGRCAGCAHLHVRREREIADKRQLVVEVLGRHGGLSVVPDRVEVLAPRTRSNLRTRASWTLRRAREEAGGVVAEFRALDGAGVDARDCPAVVPGLREGLRELVRIYDDLNEHTESEVSLAVLEDQRVVTVHAGDPVWPASRDGSLLSVGFSAVAERSERRTVCRSGWWPIGNGLAEAPEVWHHSALVGGGLVRGWIEGLGLGGGEALLDATCGSGGTLEVLGSRFGSVVAVDRHHAALQVCRQRCARLGWTHVAFRGGRLETIAPRLVREGRVFEAIVINPMRRSLGAETMDAIAALGRRDILYLAPAPRAGAEDIRCLTERGWRVDAVAALDLQPGTAAVMMAVHLVSGAGIPSR